MMGFEPAAWRRRVMRARHYTLGDVVAREEDRHHEFKASASHVDVEKYINAFCNTKGGKLLLGVRDDGTVCGVRMTRADRDAFNRKVDGFALQMRPALGAGKVAVERVPVLNGDGELYVLMVRVKREPADPHVHFTAKGQAWWRGNGGGAARPPCPRATPRTTNPAPQTLPFLRPSCARAVPWQCT